jgi:D-sedoheptulose 7-phosphate isomerase
MAILQSIQALLKESAEVKAKAAANLALTEGAARMVELVRDTIARGGTIYSCGNGGSACDAMHLTEELIARFKRERPGIRAMHFLDPGALTCWSNDYDYPSAFERYVKTFCREQDCLILFSTSGNSKNIVSAARAAKALATPVVALTGEGGGAVKEFASICIEVPSKQTERIQEVHIALVHTLLELIERE